MVPDSSQRAIFSLAQIGRAQTSEECMQMRADQHYNHCGEINTGKSNLLPLQKPNKEKRTGNIVWAHRFIIGKVELCQDLEVYITGIDMSSAFDTIKRQKLMNELNKLLDDDEWRIIMTLLSNINVPFEDCKGEEIETNIGSPQRDAISGTFFHAAFEKGLRNLQEKMNK